MNSMPPPYYGPPPPPLYTPKEKSRGLVVIVICVVIIALVLLTGAGFVFTKVVQENNEEAKREALAEDIQIEALREAWYEYGTNDQLAICEVIRDYGSENIFDILDKSVTRDMNRAGVERFFEGACNVD